MPVFSKSLQYSPFFSPSPCLHPSTLLTTSHCPQMLLSRSSRELFKTAKTKLCSQSLVTQLYKKYSHR